MKPSNWPRDLPYLDPTVKHVGATALRRLSTEALAKLDGAVAIHGKKRVLAVIVPYRTFIEMSRALEEVG